MPEKIPPIPPTIHSPREKWNLESSNLKPSLETVAKTITPIKAIIPVRKKEMF